MNTKIKKVLLGIAIFYLSIFLLGAVISIFASFRISIFGSLFFLSLSVLFGILFTICISSFQEKQIENKQTLKRLSVLFIILSFFSLVFLPKSDKDFKQEQVVKIEKQKSNVDKKSNAKNEIIQKESDKKSKKQIIEITAKDTTFIDWWNYKYQSLPSNVEGEYGATKIKTPYKFDFICNYKIDELLNYYEVLQDARLKGEISTVKGHRYDKLAERTNIHKNFWSELDTYIGMYYLNYLSEITKEYFSVNKELGIIPDYYSAINHTRYIGFLTFDCDIVVNKAKNAPDFDDEVKKSLDYLKNNLPDEIKGFRVLDVKYVNETAGTSGYLNHGYIWIRENNEFIEINKSGDGIYGWGANRVDIPQ